MHITNLSHCWVNTITSIKTRVRIHYCHISDTKRGLGKHKGEILIRGLQNKTIISFHNEPSTDLPWWPRHVSHIFTNNGKIIRKSCKSSKDWVKGMALCNNHQNPTVLLFHRENPSNFNHQR
jgi:hypothetical protein